MARRQTTSTDADAKPASVDRDLSPAMLELLRSVETFWAANGRAERIFGNRQRSARALVRRGLVRVVDVEPHLGDRHQVVLYVEPTRKQPSSGGPP